MDWIKVTPETLPPENEIVIGAVAQSGTVRPLHILWSGISWSRYSHVWELEPTDCAVPLFVENADFELLFWMPFKEVSEREKRNIAMELVKIMEQELVVDRRRLEYM